MNGFRAAKAKDLVLANLETVFNEPDAGRRMQALSAIWAEDAEMFEADAVLVGHQAISDNVGALYARFPPGTRFHAIGRPVVNHDAVLLRWGAGTDPAKPAVTGTDVGFIAQGRIRRLFVFLDPRA